MAHTWLAGVGLLLGVAGPLRAEPALRVRPPSYIEMKNAQVMQAFLVFTSSPQNAPERQDALGTLRERDEILLPAGRGPTGSAGAYGAAMLGAAVVMTAHAPAPLRPLFDARVHLGPAVFEGGGMGAGVGGKF